MPSPDDLWVSTKVDPAMTYPPDLKHERNASIHKSELPIVVDGKPTLPEELIDDEMFPSEEEIMTLPRVADHIPWRVYTVAFVELCERFSYYGTQVLFQNFVQRPLLTSTGRAPNPGGSGTGTNPGALGRGQQAATGLGTFFSFWCYVTPLFGAYIADTYLGRYNTVMYSIGIAILGHIILIISAIPGVLKSHGGSFAAYIIAIIVFGAGTGGFKPNISPLIAEQIVKEKLRVSTDKKGNKVIIDPAVTSARIYNWFYLFINIGALIGQVCMAYAALYVGYWLAFLLPTLMFLCCPIVLVLCKKNYKLTPPQGSVLGPAFKSLALATKMKFSFNPIQFHRNIADGQFWNDIKPSHMGANKPAWMTFDDAWVDEVRRGFNACLVFLWYPLYWVTYNQINNNLTSQADTMRHPGVPPEIVNNLDPFCLIILIPICDLFIYPALRRAGINFTPLKRIALGFLTGAAAMVYAAVVQNYIYKHNECGSYPSEGLPSGDDCPPTNISIWVQSGSYILIAISEILASITALEYAFTKAPKNMRSMVMAVALFMTAIANAIGEAMNPLSTDPLLVWNYGSFAVIAGVAGVLFYLCFMSLDKDEDKLNQLPTGHVGTTAQAAEFNRRASVASAIGTDSSREHEKV